MPVMLARRISDVISDISIYNVSDYTTLIMNGVTSLNQYKSDRTIRPDQEQKAGSAFLMRHP